MAAVKCIAVSMLLLSNQWKRLLHMLKGSDFGENHLSLDQLSAEYSSGSLSLCNRAQANAENKYLEENALLPYLANFRYHRKIYTACSAIFKGGVETNPS